MTVRARGRPQSRLDELLHAARTESQELREIAGACGDLLKIGIEERDA